MCERVDLQYTLDSHRQCEYKDVSGCTCIVNTLVYKCGSTMLLSYYCTCHKAVSIV